MCEQVSPGHNTWNKARRPWLESSILGWHRTQEEPGNATDALKLDSLALWPLATYTVDYPPKQKYQCFSEDPDETPASHGIRCKYSEDLWGKKMPPENMNSHGGQNSKAPQDTYLTEGCAQEGRKAFQERGARERQEDESGDASE